MILINWEHYFMKKGRRRVDDVYAFGQFMPMSVDKARKVTHQIRSSDYEDALMMLELMPYRACYPIFKLVYSIAANASHNKRFNKANLAIVKAEVNKGATMKKIKPRARGRSYLIKRRTCHINMIIRDMSYFEAFRQFMRGLSVSDQKKVVYGLQSELFYITE